MAMELSQFSRLPKKGLLFISEKLINEDFPIGNPYHYDFDESFNVLKNASKYFSIVPTQEDVEFFSKFLEINENLIADLFANNQEQMKNKGLIEQLEIPLANSYDLHFEINGTCTYTEYKSQEFDCYDKDWVTDSAAQQNNDGNWDMWDSKDIHPTEYENYEFNDYEFGDVSEIDETEIKTESILDRLVIENTSDVVKCLDKKTLIKLKSIIESRLRLI
jgi:hypothetical protein